MQLKIFDPNIDPVDAEVLNIEYEKLTQQMEKMPEFIAAQKKEKEKWARDNYDLNRFQMSWKTTRLTSNRAAFERVVASLQQMPQARRTALLKKEACLVLLTQSPEQMKKRYKGDWVSMTPHNLTLDQARAVYCVLPEFRTDQEQQLQFVEGND